MKNINKVTEKITLSVTIVIAVVVLTIGFYAVQYNKQQSIERQQILKLQEDREQQAAENKRAELKLKQEECNLYQVG